MAGSGLSAGERLRAVLFDVDFTLAKPGPELMPEGYVRCAERHGLSLEASRYEAARDAAFVDLKRHPELDHDEAIWVAFTERIVVGMGGADARAHDVAVELTSRWQRHENFELYEDVLPVLDELRGRALKLGLVSNGIRDLHEFVAHHRLDVDAIVDSRTHGRVKPHPTIFQAALDRLDVQAAQAVMVGDSLEEDVEGARALGMRAILVDRDDRYPEVEERLTELYALPAALGLIRP